MAFAAVGAACLVFMMTLAFVDVVGRTVFSAPVHSIVELTQLAMGLIVYLGLALTTLRRGHVSVDVLVAGLPPALKRIADLLAQSCVLAILALITWRLFERAETNFSDGLVTPLLAIEQYPFAFVMALGAAVASLIAVLNLAGRTDRPGA